jgi:hypothetical protein
VIAEIHTSLLLYLNSFLGTNTFFDIFLRVFASGVGVILILSVIVFVFVRERNNQKFFRVLAHISIPVLLALVYGEILKTLYMAPRP